VSHNLPAVIAQPVSLTALAAQPSVFIIQPTDLADLAAAIRERHQAVRGAVRTALADAMQCGVLLITAKDQVKGRGERWLPWLERECKLRERTVNVYMALARNREVIEEQIRSAADFSIRRALDLVSDLPSEPSGTGPSSRTGSSSRGRSKRRRGRRPRLPSQPQPQSGKPTRFDVLAWWQAAPLQERRDLVDSIGGKAWAEARPPSWHRDDIGAASVGKVARLNVHIEELHREIHRRDATIAALQRQLGIEPNDGLDIPAFLLRSATTNRGD
jgi:hypothetical protein